MVWVYFALCSIGCRLLVQWECVVYDMMFVLCARCGLLIVVLRCCACIKRNIWWWMVRISPHLSSAAYGNYYRSSFMGGGGGPHFSGNRLIAQCDNMCVFNVVAEESGLVRRSPNIIKYRLIPH